MTSKIRRWVNCFGGKMEPVNVFEELSESFNRWCQSKDVEKLEALLEQRDAEIEGLKKRIEELETRRHCEFERGYKLHRRDLDIANQKIEMLQKHLSKIAEIKAVSELPPIIIVKKEDPIIVGNKGARARKPWDKCDNWKPKESGE